MEGEPAGEQAPPRKRMGDTSLGIETSFFRMKEPDIRADKKRLQELLQIRERTYGVNYVKYNHIEEVWEVAFDTKEQMEPWSHLTHWAGKPLVKKVDRVIGL